MARAAAILIALAALAAGAMATGEDADRLARARALLERQDFGDARRAFEKALGGGGLDPVGVRDAYRGLAESSAALRRPDDARDAYIRLLLVDPTHYVPSDASPIVREPFAQAQEALREGGVGPIGWTSPRRIPGDEPLTIEVDLPGDVAPGFAVRVEVTVRPGGGGAASTIAADRGRAVIPAGTLDGVERLEIAIAVYDEHDNLVAALGTADEPLVVAVGGEVEEAPAEPAAGRDEPRRRWYQRWWFWTIVGAVVVGAAVAIPVGLTAGSDDDPCVTALGGPCDLEVRF